jgi:hypothetical protein
VGLGLARAVVGRAFGQHARERRNFDCHGPPVGAAFTRLGPYGHHRGPDRRRTGACRTACSTCRRCRAVLGSAGGACTGMGGSSGRTSGAARIRATSAATGGSRASTAPTGSRTRGPGVEPGAFTVGAAPSVMGRPRRSPACMGTAGCPASCALCGRAAARRRTGCPAIVIVGRQAARARGGTGRILGDRGTGCIRSTFHGLAVLATGGRAFGMGRAQER